MSIKIAGMAKSALEKFIAFREIYRHKCFFNFRTKKNVSDLKFLLKTRKNKEEKEGMKDK